MSLCPAFRNVNSDTLQSACEEPSVWLMQLVCEAFQVSHVEANAQVEGTECHDENDVLDFMEKLFGVYSMTEVESTRQLNNQYMAQLKEWTDYLEMKTEEQPLVCLLSTKELRRALIRTEEDLWSLKVLCQVQVDQVQPEATESMVSIDQALSPLTRPLNPLMTRPLSPLTPHLLPPLTPRHHLFPPSTKLLVNLIPTLPVSPAPSYAPQSKRAQPVTQLKASTVKNRL